jgi:hypothetical protein
MASQRRHKPDTDPCRHDQTGEHLRPPYLVRGDRLPVHSQALFRKLECWSYIQVVLSYAALAFFGLVPRTLVFFGAFVAGVAATASAPGLRPRPMLRARTERRSA